MHANSVQRYEKNLTYANVICKLHGKSIKKLAYIKKKLYLCTLNACRWLLAGYIDYMNK